MPRARTRTTIFEISRDEVAQAIESAAELRSTRPEIDALTLLGLTQGQAFNELVQRIQSSLEDAWYEIVMEAADDYLNDHLDESGVLA